MNLHDRFKQLYHAKDNTPKNYYARVLLDGLYEQGVVSNTPSPIPLPNWDDDEDLRNIIQALDMLKADILGMLEPVMGRSPFRTYYDRIQKIEMAGSFDNALYHLWFKADAKNKKNLIKGFPHFFSNEDYQYFCGTSKTEDND